MFSKGFVPRSAHPTPLSVLLNQHLLLVFLDTPVSSQSTGVTIQDCCGSGKSTLW